MQELFGLLNEDTIPTATLVRAARRRMPLANPETLLRFGEVVTSIAEDRGNNTRDAYKDFVATMRKAAKSGEEWAIEVAEIANIPLTRPRRVRRTETLVAA